MLPDSIEGAKRSGRVSKRRAEREKNKGKPVAAHSHNVDRI